MQFYLCVLGWAIVYLAGLVVIFKNGNKSRIDFELIKGLVNGTGFEGLIRKTQSSRNTLAAGTFGQDAIALGEISEGDAADSAQERSKPPYSGEPRLLQENLEGIIGSFAQRVKHRYIESNTLIELEDVELTRQRTKQPYCSEPWVLWDNLEDILTDFTQRLKRRYIPIKVAPRPVQTPDNQQELPEEEVAVTWAGEEDSRLSKNLLVNSSGTAIANTNGAKRDVAHLKNGLPTPVPPRARESATTDPGEPNKSGTLIGILPSNDPNTGETYTYSLINNAGGCFILQGNELWIVDETLANPQSDNNYIVTVRRTNANGAYIDKSFVISLNQDDTN
jgi:hypothetical protein